MAHAWKACWVKALGGSNPPFSASNSLELEPQKGDSEREFLLLVQLRVQLTEPSKV